MTVGPAVTFAQTQGKNPPVLFIDGFENVRNDFQALVVGHQAGVAVNHHQAHVLAATHQQSQLAAVMSRRALGFLELSHAGGFRQPLRQRRQLTELNPSGKLRGFRPGQRSNGKRGRHQDRAAAEHRDESTHGLWYSTARQGRALRNSEGLTQRRPGAAGSKRLKYWP